jgi:RimJ/RimL family protein N-acetyltransferase
VPPLPDDRLLQIQVATLYRVRADGRLLAVNESDEPPAPRLFLGRTRLGNVVRYRYDLPDDVVRALDPIVAREPVATELAGAPPATFDALLAVLRPHDAVGGEWRGPAFRFPEGDERPVGHPVVEIEERNAALLAGPFAAFRGWLREIRPCVAVVRDGAAVAVCHASRRSVAAAEAGVETIPACRGRGYGAAVVAAWARAVRREGLLPLYSTSWDNAASRRLAEKLGLVLYAEDFAIT